MAARPKPFDDVHIGLTSLCLISVWTENMEKTNEHIGLQQDANHERIGKIS